MDFHDQMTGKERMAAFWQGKAIDRIPIVPDMGVTMAGICGLSCYEYYHSAKRMAEVEIALYRRFHHEGLSISTTLRGMAEAMGSTILYPENSVSQLGQAAVCTEADMEALEPVNPLRDGKLPIFLEALERLLQALGDEADIGASMAAPFSVCASVLGMENLLLWMVRKPEALHRLLELIAENNRRYIEAVAKLGLGVGFCDPVSSASVVSPEQFRVFSLPYLKKNVAHVLKYCKSRPAVHICGASAELWQDIAEMKIGVFSMDNCEDLSRAKQVLGGHMAIAGNVPPVEVMYLGKEEDVRLAVRGCIRKGWDSPNGYILATGCQIPMGTPLENIDAFMKWGRCYGRFPSGPSI